MINKSNRSFFDDNALMIVVTLAVVVLGGLALLQPYLPGVHQPVHYDCPPIKPECGACPCPPK